MTVNTVLTEFHHAKKTATEWLYHIVLRPLKEPITQHFLYEHNGEKSLAYKITEQILNQTKVQPYYMPGNFMSDISAQEIKDLNEHNDLFTIFLETPEEETRKVRIILKAEVLYLQSEQTSNTSLVDA